MRFHLPALPEQPVTKANATCAFTQKVRKFAEMMVPRGHEVIVYGDPEHDSMPGGYVACYERNGGPPPFEPQLWEPYNDAALRAILERAEPEDFLGLMGGRCQESLTDLPMIACEYGIGYGGSFASFRVFESYAWMHTTYGQQRGTDTANGSFYDAVINAYFEPEDFPYRENPDDYLLYVGRLEERKGVQVACEVARRMRLPLLLAGAGPYEPTYGVQMGVVNPAVRGELMSRARALLAPTIYIEPFGCVAVEAQLCGTPAITTDWGAFVETVQPDLRCRTLAEFCDAVERSGDVDRPALREHAQTTWSLEAIAPQYERYFERLGTLRGDGWYT